MKDKEIETILADAMREADEMFEITGGSTKHFVRECLMPMIDKYGLIVLRKEMDLIPVQPNYVDALQSLEAILGSIRVTEELLSNHNTDND